jgi:hypothetical protein
MPEVKAVSGMLGFVQTEDPYSSSCLDMTDRYLQDVFGSFQFSLDSQEAVRVHRKTILLGSAAAEALKKKVGDTLAHWQQFLPYFGDFQSGDAFEDGGRCFH